MTAKNNMCLSCHNQPALIDKPQPKGVATPMPKSHYIDTRRAPDKVTDKPSGARFICTQCHVPQAGVQPLVDNTL